MLLLFVTMLFANGPQDLLTYEDVKPIFVNNCSSCHNGDTSEKNWLDKNVATTNKTVLYKRLIVEGDMPVFLKYFSPYDRDLLEQWLTQDVVEIENK